MNSPNDKDYDIISRPDDGRGFEPWQTTEMHLECELHLRRVTCDDVVTIIYSFVRPQVELQQVNNIIFDYLWRMSREMQQYMFGIDEYLPHWHSLYCMVMCTYLDYAPDDDEGDYDEGYDGDEEGCDSDASEESDYYDDYEAYETIAMMKGSNL